MFSMLDERMRAVLEILAEGALTFTSPISAERDLPGVTAALQARYAADFGATNDPMLHVKITSRGRWALKGHLRPSLIQLLTENAKSLLR